MGSMDVNTLKILLTPAIVGIVEALKPTGLLGPDNCFAPLVSILLGAVGAALVGLTNGSMNVAMDWLSGIAIGAAATGIYAAVTSIGSGTVTVVAPPATAVVTPIPGPGGTI